MGIKPSNLLFVAAVVACFVMFFEASPAAAYDECQICKNSGDSIKCKVPSRAGEWSIARTECSVTTRCYFGFCFDFCQTSGDRCFADQLLPDGTLERTACTGPKLEDVEETTDSLHTESNEKSGA